LLRHFAEARSVLHDLLEFGIVDHSGQTVGAQEEYIAGLGVDRYDVRRYDVVGAQDPREDTGVGMGAGLLAGEDAGINTFLDPGMVAGQLRHAAGPQAVGS
jgi:hypothetical protein